MTPKPKWEPKKMPRVNKKAAPTTKCEPKKMPRVNKTAPLKPNTTEIAKPKKYPKGSVGREWREQVAASQKRARQAAAASVAWAASCQPAAETSTTSISCAAQADDSLAHSESDLESDPFSDIFR